MQARKPVVMAAIVLAVVAIFLFVLNDKPRAPQLTLTTLDGKPLSLDSLRGKVVLMNYDPPEYVRNFSRQHQLPFVVALDGNGEAARGFNQVKLTPTTFLIDRNGHIIQQTIGELDFPKLYSLLDQQLRNAT